MKLSFIYLDSPFWRAEVGKIALYIGGIEFENKIITREEFQRVKIEGHLDDGTIIPFHQLPCLIVDGFPIAQTGGISRFCGKLSGIYPKNDDLLAARIDQFVDIATDITVLIFSCGVNEEEEIRRAKRRELSRGDLARKLRMLDKNITDDGDWVVQPSMGLADIAIWRLMGWLSSGTVDGIPTNILKDFPKIARVCSAVDSNTKIQEWVRKTYPTNYIRGNYL